MGYFEEVTEKLDGMTNEQFDELLIKSGIEKCPIERKIRMIEIKKIGEIGIDGNEITGCNCCDARNCINGFNNAPAEDIYTIIVGSDGSVFSDSMNLCKKHLIELGDSIK